MTGDPVPLGRLLADALDTWAAPARDRLDPQPTPPQQPEPEWHARSTGRAAHRRTPSGTAVCGVSPGPHGWSPARAGARLCLRCALPPDLTEQPTNPEESR